MAYHIKDVIYLRVDVGGNTSIVDNDSFVSMRLVERAGGYLPIGAIDVAVKEELVDNTLRTLKQGSSMDILFGTKQDEAKSFSVKILSLDISQQTEEITNIHLEFIQKSEGWTLSEMGGQILTGTSTSVIEQIAIGEGLTPNGTITSAIDSMNWACGNWTPMEACQKIATRYAGNNTPHDYLALAATLMDGFKIQDVSMAIAQDYKAEFSLNEEFSTQANTENVSVLGEMVKRSGDPFAQSIEGYQNTTRINSHTGESEEINFTPDQNGLFGARTPSSQGSFGNSATTRRIKPQLTNPEVHASYVEARLSSFFYGSQASSIQIEPISDKSGLNVELLDTVLFRDIWNANRAQVPSTSGIYMVSQKITDVTAGNEISVAFLLNRDVIGN